MLKIQPLITANQIESRVRELAADLNRDYQDRTVDIVCVLKGAMIFVSDLVRLLEFPVRLHLLRVQSYSGGTESSGTVCLHFSSEFELEDRNVLLIDDIVDTGITLRFLLDYLMPQKPHSLKSCVLLNKPARRKLDIYPDYSGFEIEDHFVVGYGLDYNEQGRNLPYIGILINPD
jgi:hypoxanthine phosphoribosyltransferase